MITLLRNPAFMTGLVTVFVTLFGYLGWVDPTKVEALVAGLVTVFAALQHRENEKTMRAIRTLRRDVRLPD